MTGFLALLLALAAAPAAGAAAPPRGVPAGPLTMEEVAQGTTAVGTAFAHFRFTERALAHASAGDENIAELLRLQAAGQVGDVASIKALPRGGGLLVLHRSRCCSGWCAAVKPGPADPDPCADPQPDAAALLLRRGSVERRYLAGRVRLPHSLSLSADGRTFLCVDKRGGIVLRVDIETGAEIASYGAPWAGDALARGAAPGALAALHARARAALGPGALGDPAGAADSSDGRVFVGSGYLDQRVLVFNSTTGDVIAEIFRAPPKTLAAAAALQAAGRAGDARAPVAVPAGRADRGTWRDMCAAPRGALDGGAACDAGVETWAAEVAAGGGGGGGGGAPLSMSGMIAAGADPASGAPALPPWAPRANASSCPAAGGGAGSDRDRASAASAATPAAHVVFDDTKEWGWQLPHSLLIDEARRRLYVANRGRPAVEVLDLDTYAPRCSYSLRALCGGDGMAMALAADEASGRLFVNVDSHSPGSASVVELNPDVCGEALAIYATPLGAFPQHDLGVVASEDGGAAFYVATRPPVVWHLPAPRPGPAGAAPAARAAARAVAQLLEAQVASLLALGLAIPVAYLLLAAARAAARRCGRAGRAAAARGRSAAAPARGGRGAGAGGAGGGGGRQGPGGGGAYLELTVAPGSFTHASRRHRGGHAGAGGEHHGLSGIAEDEDGGGGGGAGGGDYRGDGLSAQREERYRDSDDGVCEWEEAALLAAPAPGSQTGRLASHGALARGGAPGAAEAYVSPFLALSGRAESQLLVAALAARSFASGRSSLPPRALSLLTAAALAAEEGAAPSTRPFPAGPPAGPPTAQPATPGAVYFVRHGESTSNERGVLAGVIDVNLTRFGQLQARQAGADILRKRVRFDAVYTSHLRRAAYTARAALAAAGQGDLNLLHDSRIAERSFGIFAGEPIRLLQLALGYDAYEELMHSAHSAPPLGEPIAAVYARVASFYEEVAAPLAAAGSNVLVVSHQYALEPLAMYLSGLPPEAYRNVNLPNGKAMSVQDLRDYVAAEGGGWRAAMQETGDRLSLLSVALAPAFFIAGVALAAAGYALSAAGARFAVVIALGVSTFYTLLDVDVPKSFQKAPRAAAAMVALQSALRAAAAAAVLARAAALRAALAPGEAAAAEHAFAYATLGALLWLAPPALTAPATSQMWGGGLYLAVACATALTVLLPPVILIAAAGGAMPGVRVASLGFFLAVAAAGCGAPAAAAAAARARWPVAAKKHSKSWKWLAAPALWALAFVGGGMAAPPSLLDGLFSPLILAGAELRPLSAAPLDSAGKASRAVHVIALQSLVLIAASFLAMRFAALTACWVLAAWRRGGGGGGVAHGGGAAGGGGGDGERGAPEHQEAPLRGDGVEGSSGGAPAGGFAGAARQHGHGKPHGHGLSKASAAARGPPDLMDLIDVFILLTQPNFFMFAALGAGLTDVAGAPVGRWVTFWAAALFFCLPALEQAAVVRSFMRRALLRSHDTAVPEGQLRALWAAFAGGEAEAEAARAGSGGAAAEAVVAAARAMATADSLDPSSPTSAALARYTARQLLARLAGGGAGDPGGGGTGGPGGGGAGVNGGGGAGAVAYSRFADYFRQTGGTVNLNPH